MKFKQFIAAVIALISCLNYMVLPVFAEDVTITGKYSGKLVFETDNNYVFKASNAMPGEEWQTNLYFKNTSDYVINMELSEITDNGSDEVLLSNMYLTLNDGENDLYDGVYPYDQKPVTRVFQIQPNSELTVSAVCGISPFASNGIMNKAMNTSWVFNGTLVDPRNAGDFTDANGDVVITDDEGNTYKIRVINHEDNPIENAHVEIKDGNIVIDLPDGETVTKQTPVTVYVTDNEDTPVKAIPVEVRDIEGDDFVNKTNADGKAVVPVQEEGYTDSEGNVTLVDENGNIINVNVSDIEGKPVANAKVIITPDGIQIKMPDGRIITREDAIVVTVTDEDYDPIRNVPVTAIDDEGNSFSDNTNEDGKTFLPILRENYTDDDGKAEVVDDNGNHYIVTVKDDNEVSISNAKIRVDENGISVELPDGTILDIDNPTHVIVTNKDEVPVPMAPVKVTDEKGQEASSFTDTTGEIIVPVSPSGRTAPDGHVRITDGEGNVYKVVVEDETGSPIEDVEVYITDEGEIKVNLPEPVKVTPYLPIVVTVTDEDDEPREGVKVEAKDSDDVTVDDTTDISGKAKMPVSDEAVTDDNGEAVVTSSEGVRYIVDVATIKQEPIPNARVQIKADKIEVILPDEYTLIAINQTVVTVSDKEHQPMADVSVTVTDKDEKTASKNTDTNGQITVPDKPRSTGGGGGGGGGGGSANALSIHYRNDDGTAGDDVSSLTAKAGEKAVALVSVIQNKLSNMTVTWTSDNESVAIVDKNGVVAFVGEGTATITAQSNGSKSLKDTVKVTVKAADKALVSSTPEPSKDGYKKVHESLISPFMFSPYISGYEDGDFRPDSPISREELSAIFARIIANNMFMDKDYKTSFSDVPDNWSKSYIGYLEQFEIVNGYGDGLFKPYNKITRAEMAVMLAKTLGYDVTPDIKASDVPFLDVDEGYASWSAAKAILILSDLGIMSGYPDNTFRPGQSITRAEVVATINRVLASQTVVSYDRIPTDMTDAHWAYSDVLFAMNARQYAITGGETASWSEWFNTIAINKFTYDGNDWDAYKTALIKGDGNNGKLVSATSEPKTEEQLEETSGSDGNVEVHLYGPSDVKSMIKGIPISGIVVGAVAVATAAAVMVFTITNKKRRKGRSSK